ncbi:MAG: lipopolysaccharide biosynthesis protein [Bacteroidetes bacterium]|uniref:Lipopolysaccharide biosynthesis protein n=1 Tax=Candidatus Gallipaludibacter merdavium TaxID=2840839 RepID=A0A9D9N5D0_9BACT|nr:lipopolysaccharide biosynthesis protein [Candidatus Gallipaludibacter merdavium]
MNALAWSAADRTVQQALQLIIGIWLARILSPSDFGLMGIIMLFAGISYVFVEGGFGQAVARIKGADNRYFTSIWIMNLAIASLLYIILYLSAPYISIFFGQPQLKAIIRILFLALFFNAGYLIQHTQLGIQLDYRSIAFCNITATFISGICGITIAYVYKNVWALVAQQVTYHFFRLCCFSLVTKWLPSRHISLQPIRQLGRFSINLMGTSLLNALFSNLFVTFIGKFYPISYTGYYSQAQKQNDTIQFTFISILNGVSYNIFALLHENTTRLKNFYTQLLHKSALLTLPVFCVLITLSEPFFSVLLGEKWISSVPYFQLLCGAQLLCVCDLLCINLLNARGKSRITFRIELIKKTGMLATLFVFASYGIYQGIIAYGILNWGIGFTWLYLAKKELSLSWNVLWKSVIPALGIGIIVSCLIWNIGWILNTHIYIELLIQLSIGIACYCLLLHKVYPGLIKDIKQLIPKDN